MKKTETIHGVFVEVFGVGIVIVGKSGMGKSECALDLVARGHRLIADDVVKLSLENGQLWGEPDAALKDFLEIRGLGVLNINDLFGVASIRDHKIVEMIVEFFPFPENRDYDRLGFEENYKTYLGAKIPFVTIPVSPGRYLTTLVEVAARNYLLKLRGRFSSKDFEKRINKKLFKSSGKK